MSIERFKRLLEAYGADARRWPEADWTRAQSLLASSPEARKAWSAAASLDSLLDHHPAEIGEGAVERCFERIVAGVDSRQATAPVPLVAGRFARASLPRASLFAVFAVLGFLVGMSGWGEPGVTSASASDTLSITYGGDFAL